jgi:hypothetical protein
MIDRLWYLTMLFELQGFNITEWDGKMIINDKQERILKVVIIAHLKVLFHHLPGGTIETIANINHNSQVSHKYEARVLSTQL